MVRKEPDFNVATDQVVITNRIVREIILKYGVSSIVSKKGQISIGAIEDIFDIENAVKGKYGSTGESAT